MSRVLLTWLAWSLACHGCSQERELKQPDVNAWNGWRFAGCAKVLQGARCVLRAHESLRFWSPQRLTFSMDGAAIQPSEAPHEAGLTYTLSQPHASGLIVRDVQGRALKLQLLELPEPLQPVIELKKRGQLPAAQAALLRWLESNDATTRADALSLQARLLLQSGKMREARAAFERSIAAQHDAGCVSCVGHDALATAFIDIIHMRDMAHARTMLALVASVLGASELEAELLYMRALLALRTGDLLTALTGMQHARVAATRLDLRNEESSAREVQATTLMRLGHYADAAERLQELEHSETDSCDRAHLLRSLGRLGLLQLESSAIHDRELEARIGAELAEALRLSIVPCAKPSLTADTMIDLSRYALQRGDFSKARALALEAQAMLPERDEEIELWSSDVLGRAALAGGDAEAGLAAFQALVQHAQRVQALEAEWRGTVGVARALAAVGRTAEAALQYARSEDILDLESTGTPLSTGRETFLGTRALAQSEYLRVLLQLGDPQAVFDAALRARHRVLTAVSRTRRIAQLTASQRERWERAAEVYQLGRESLALRMAGDWQLARSTLAAELDARARTRAQLDRTLEQALAQLGLTEPARQPRARTERELVVVLHELTSGVLLMYERADKLEARVLEHDPNRERPLLLHDLAREIEPQLQGIQRVRVLASGSLQALDIHALPLSQGVLLERAAVVYGSDLTAPVEQRAVARALVLADSRSDLPHALSEAETTRKQLLELGMSQVQTLIGDDVTAERVLNILPSVDVLHVAVHAERAASTWYNGLTLAAGATLSIGDILTLQNVPSLVFLAGCDTALSDAAGPAQGLSLAHAFIAAGTRAALASTRPVADDTTQELAADFYAWLSVKHEPAQALRAAQLDLRSRHNHVDWSAFRVLTP